MHNILIGYYLIDDLVESYRGSCFLETNIFHYMKIFALSTQMTMVLAKCSSTY
jgi:hypothetical protein